ncbi:MAG: SDR family oxidoreductase [Candidatus Latescibacteria bacterium]|nr:SDR family oxidoreductase [Candidatus Latescibacterota bacterium]
MIKEKFSLTGSRGIITGASRGLGRGMAEGLAEMGADLVITAKNMDLLEEVSKELRKFGGKIVPFRADAGNDDDVSRLAEAACNVLGGIDFVICNAGIIRRGPAHEHSIKDFDDVFNINVRSVFLLAQKAAQIMITQGHGGSIVITDSIVSVHGSMNVPGYTSSKGAVNSLIRALANDWGQYGIRVNGIGPGFCETDMTEGVRGNSERYRYLSSRMALGRWGRPDDFAGAAVYLVSDASSYVTGTTLYIDGGFLSM